MDRGSDVYKDIIDLEYPFPLGRPRMSQRDRAAQFSAFAALPGYDAAIAETERLTETMIDLDEEAKNILNTKLQIINNYISFQPVVEITRFIPDERKDGGAYITITERIKKVDEYEKAIVTTTGLAIPIDEIYGLEGEIFKCLEDSQ